MSKRHLLQTSVVSSVSIPPIPPVPQQRPHFGQREAVHPITITRASTAKTSASPMYQVVTVPMSQAPGAQTNPTTAGNHCVRRAALNALLIWGMSAGSGGIGRSILLYGLTTQAQRPRTFSRMRLGESHNQFSGVSRALGVSRIAQVPVGWP
jgi:hypothetical protein